MRTPRSSHACARPAPCSSRSSRPASSRFGDQWSGGRTNNPWNPAEGSSGSSAGPGAATAAGLVGFSIGVRHRRIDPLAVGSLRPRRPAADVRAREPARRDGRWHDARQDRSDVPLRRRTARSSCARRLGLTIRISPWCGTCPVTWDPAAGRYPKRIGYVPAMLEAERDPEQRANNQRALDMLKRLGCTTQRDQPAAGRSQLLHRVRRARGRVRLVHHERPAQRPEPAHRAGYLRACQLVTAVDYLQANRRRAVSHAGGRARDARRRRGDVHHADAQFSDEPESGDEPDRTSVDRGAERVSRERHADGRDVLRSSLSRGGDHGAGASPQVRSETSAARDSRPRRRGRSVGRRQATFASTETPRNVRSVVASSCRSHESAPVGAMPTDFVPNVVLRPVPASSSRHSDSAAKRHFNGKPGAELRPTHSLPRAVGLQRSIASRVHEQDFAVFAARHFFSGERPGPRQRRDVTELAQARVAVPVRGASGWRRARSGRRRSPAGAP